MTAPRIITSRLDAGPWTIWQACDDRMGWDSSPIGNRRTEAEAIEE